MTLNDEVRIVRIGSTGIDGTGITDPEKLQITSDIAELQELTQPPASAIIAGRYFGTLSSISSYPDPGNFGALVPNRLMGSYFSLPVDATFDQMVVNVITAVAGSTMRLGVYGVTAAGLPGALVADLGTVDTSVAGDRIVPIALDLLRGRYWLAGAATDGITIQETTSGAGVTSILGHVNTTGLTPRSALYRSPDLTAGFAALPSTFGTIITSGVIPVFWLRAA